jgi:anti-sigma-K factor RskA
VSESVHLLAGAYALDALDPAERAEFEAHLSTCPECTDEVRGMLATAARLGSAESVRPSPELRGSVLAEVAHTPQERPLGSVEDQGRRVEGPAAGGSGRPGGGRGHDDVDGRDEAAVVVPLRRRRTQLLLSVAAAVLAVVAVGLAVLLVQTRSDRNALAERQQQLTAVLAAQDSRTVGASLPGGGRAVVVVSDSKHEAALVGTGMSSPPPGHVYQLWYLGSDNTAVSAGLFTPAANGTAAVLLQGDPTRAAKIGLTIEPDGGSPRPTTTPVLAVTITA